MAQYVETLIAEIQATPAAGAALETVFFGGGTPSLLSVPQLEAILHALDQRFGIAPAAEISMEMDPATFDRVHLEGYRAAGINRVSLGVQAFQDEILAASGRFHRRGDIFRAVELLQQAQIANVSFDLMSGLPHQTPADWQDSLEQAIALHPTHLSHYDLIVEPQTAFSRYFTPGKAPLPSDEATAEMYRTAQAMLTASGYDHYEICNYAKPGYQARHNLTYWQAQPCYGFGMGATSYLNHQRIDRPRTQRTYRQWVADFVGRAGHTQDPVLPLSERVLESIMVGLRLKQGISLEGVYQAYGEAGIARLSAAISPHIRSRWVTVESADSAQGNLQSDLQGDSNVTKLKPTSRLRLNDPEGFLMSNIVIVDAFNALEAR